MSIQQFKKQILAKKLQQGQAFVEYSVVLVVVVVIAMVAMRALGFDLFSYIDGARGNLFG